MFFMGTCAAGYYNSTNQMKVEDDNIKKITVTRGEFDRLNVTRDGSDAAFADADGWNYNTAFIAEFNGTLDAGNISYQLEQIDAIRIKHRRKGDLKWNTLYEKPIADYADLEFDYFDRIAGNRTEYEYCAVPVVNGIEGSIVTNSIVTDFHGCFILDKDAGYGTELEIEKGTITRTMNSGVYTTLKGKYPVVVTNGEADYYTGTMRVMFLPTDSDFDYVQDGAYRYREEIMEFLNNRKPKLLKFDDGRVYIVSITGPVTDENDVIYGYVHTSFGWTEIGDVKNSVDLYENGFIDLCLEE